MQRFISVLLVLITLVSMLSVSTITASATDGYYELSEYEDSMYIYYNPYGMEVPSSVDYVKISDAYLDKPLDFDNGKINHIVFKNCVIDMSQLGSFEKVDAVTMINCELQDLSYLSENTNIAYLDLDCCYIASLNGIQYLANLKSLFVYDVGIESIEFLKHNKKLEELCLSNTCVADLSPIENMDIKYLCISNTLSIRDLSPVMTMDELESFYSDNCEMAYTTELCDFIKKNRIDNDISDDWQEIQESVKGTADELFTPNMSDDEKIEVAVDYVVDIMEYDYGVFSDEDLSWEYNDKALSYAIKGEGVCRNYSALTMVLLQKAGITVYEIKGPDHIWNIVLIGDDFYWLDVTWLDDGSGEFTDSDYYMNGKYDFVDHQAFTVPSSMYNPDYAPKFVFAIYIPSKTTIRHRDGIILHTSFKDEWLEGAEVIWSYDNDNFDVTCNEDGTITIVSDNNGYTTFTATLYDADGNVLGTDTVEMRSKAGFFDKIGSFFRSIFGGTKIYEY